jgi:ABC-type polysaccharide/polyol phosphate transport system ATPase subunit
VVVPPGDPVLEQAEVVARAAEAAYIVPPIANFTELGEMLDLPLKCFSTGRIMLLSFAIAACCEPDCCATDVATSAVIPVNALTFRLMASSSTTSFSRW